MLRDHVVRAVVCFAFASWLSFVVSQTFVSNSCKQQNFILFLFCEMFIYVLLQ